MCLLFILLLFGLLCTDFTTCQTCHDTDTTACSLLQRSNPNLCSDPSVAQSICPRFCGLCPLTCYNCQSPIYNPKSCNETAVCHRNETCLLKERKASTGNHEYIMMCEKQVVCDGLGLGFPALGRRDSKISLQSRDVSIMCCKKDLCNMPVLLTDSPSTTKSTKLPVTVSSGQINCARDILFIVDSSDSLGPSNFQLMKNFVASVINELTIGVSESLVAIMSFSTSVYLEFNLNTYNNKQALMNAVPHIRYIGLGTNTSYALNYARTRVFTSVAGDRQGFANVVIILTDGRSGNPVQTAIEAAALQHVAKVIVIGIGPATAINELQVIATDPDQQNVLLVRDFHELQTMLIPILSVVC